MTHPRQELRWLTLAMLLAFALLLFTMAIKWQRFGYTGLDLAIYTQAMEQTRLGQPMAITIHPHSYFGDHVELILFVLLPLYALLPSPLTLLVLQAAALIVGAVPVFFLAKRRFPAGIIPLGAVVAYLIHPFVLNTALFEFHALPFAIPLIFWAILAYERRQWGWFMLSLFGALLAREDVALVSLGFGLLAIIDRRSLRWIVVPLAAGAIWLRSLLLLAGYFNQQGEYKFLKLYGWLGATVPDMLRTVVTRPWVLFQRLLGPTSIVTLLGAFLPFAYLPVLAPRMLLAAVFVFLQLLLLGLGENGLRIHYTALILPFLFVAGLDGLAKIAQATKGRVLPHLRREWGLATLTLCTVLISASLIIGPFGAIAHEAIRGDRPVAAEDRAAWSLLQTLQRPVRAVSTFRPITPLAQSPDVYSAHYVFLGHRQYTDDPYPVSDRVTELLLDDRDLLTFQLLYQGDDDVGYGRIADFLAGRNFSLAEQVGHLHRYRVGGTGPRPFSGHAVAERLNDRLTLTGIQPPTVTTEGVGTDYYPIATLGLRFRADETMDENYQIRFTFADDRGRIQEELFALNPLEPTRTWKPGFEYAWVYRPVLQRMPVGRFQVSAQLVSVKGLGGLDGFRSIVPRYQSVKPVGNPVTLNP